MLAARLAYGKKKELELAPRLARYLNTVLTPTVKNNCPYDYDTTEGERVELKSRRAALNERTKRPVTAETYNDYLFPVCKTVGLTVPLHIFYHFETDDRLFYCLYEKEKFNTFQQTVPYPSKQIHFLIPRTEFKEVV